MAKIRKEFKKYMVNQQLKIQIARFDQGGNEAQNNDGTTEDAEDKFERLLIKMIINPFVDRL